MVTPRLRPPHLDEGRLVLGVLELVHARREDRVDHGRVRVRDKTKGPRRVRLHPSIVPALKVPPEHSPSSPWAAPTKRGAALVAPERVVRPRAVVGRAQRWRLPPATATTTDRDGGAASAAGRSLAAAARRRRESRAAARRRGGPRVAPVVVARAPRVAAAVGQRPGGRSSGRAVGRCCARRVDDGRSDPCACRRPPGGPSRCRRPIGLPVIARRLAYRKPSNCSRAATSERFEGF